ncbi:MAG TPA: adenylosuccinate lyase [Gemmatimonadota bacterium]|nr:adenylosuccinate lyase [Gemmatimonadota bacterium]
MSRAPGAPEAYPHPLLDRYASPEMAAIFSPRRQALLWRDLWIALAEAERDLGVEIPDGALEAMRETREEIDLGRVAELEAELRHDVMAHVHHFGEVAPEARGHIHLGATSCFVTDNAGLLQHREALRLVRRRLVGAVAALGRFAREHAGLAALGYTHLQPAQPTTMGKRACLWIQDLLLDLAEVDRALEDLRLRGARGTTGTEASFLRLLGSGKAVDRLNADLAERFGFPGTYDVVGQTYPRKVDHRCLAALAGIGASTARFGHDIRLLQSFGEAEEPFGSRQIGSSAMPYKRNPMRSERICALARHLCVLELDASWTASVQWMERTLDDSANRRISLPEAYLSADAVLRLQTNVAAGLVVHPAVVERRLRRQLPFLVVEEVLVAGVEAGGDRQELHERVRGHAMEARRRLDEGAGDNDFLDRVAGDPAFGLDRSRLEALARPADLVGRAPEQVERFLRERVDPIVERAGAAADPDVTLRV